MSTRLYVSKMKKCVQITRSVLLNIPRQTRNALETWLKSFIRLFYCPSNSRMVFCRCLSNFGKIRIPKNLCPNKSDTHLSQDAFTPCLMKLFGDELSCAYFSKKSTIHNCLSNLDANYSGQFYAHRYRPWLRRIHSNDYRKSPV